MDLQSLRLQINQLDKTILDAFAQRMALCRQVGVYKKEHQLPVFQKDREDEVIRRIRDMAPPDMSQSAAALFSAIMDISKCYQQQILADASWMPPFRQVKTLTCVRAGCQGTRGSNSEAALRMLFPEAEAKFYATFSDVCKAVESGEIDCGILPIQNTTTGTVIPTYELLYRQAGYIAATVDLEIQHCLAARKGMDPARLTTVCSHPQALQQCSGFLRDSGLEQLSYSNTATAARFVAESQLPYAAVCSPQCAEQYGLEILHRNIADAEENVTKFICFTKECLIPEEADTVSIIAELPNQAGSLSRLLNKFSANGLDLQKLESRPIADGSFDVRFYLDFSGSVLDPKVNALLADLSGSLSEFRFLGNHLTLG
ncbi:bifunctional chorismate mutase/prephenate dehydratase [uncultured Ruminococcus sp.]|uniref:bifunctional chorismate mutase/prephenate dehydratase n=1 Tax=uncultured Ruminococcus sp. TaxID=165186 RepID=UPI0025F7B0A5|nr:bifunctional chorismate mutase/prephenate dehydratase [uncultured Ruminococcus sp.]